MGDKDRVLEYKPYAVPMQFHKDLHMFVRALCGPFGSGKSVTCVEELMFIAMRQKPAPDGCRYTKFGVIRSTYPSLKTTTKKTMESWYPSECGGIKESVPLEGRYRIPLPDQTTVIMDLLLIAVEDEKSIKKLRSTDFTAIWINEATEVPYQVFNAAIERVNRYPSNNLGTCTWSGIIMDYNKPPKGHWLLNLFDSPDTPENYGYYEQPAAAFKHVSDDGVVTYETNPDADNLEILGPNYYQEQINSKMLVGDYDSIDQLLCLLEVESKEGKPVFPTFDRTIHVAPRVLQPIAGYDVIMGVDTSGIHPAAVISQFNGRQYSITDELYGEDTGLEDFIYGALLPVLQARYTGCKVLAVCDPANARNAFNATAPTVTFREANIPAIIAPSNVVKTRIEAGHKVLGKMIGGILISPNCELLIEALAGEYKYRAIKIKGTTDLVYSAEPVKNEFSHVADAFEYLCLHILRSIDSGSANEVKQKMRSLIQAKRRIM